MRVAVVYYSMSNNTEYVAKKIKERMDCDLIRLNPVKEYPSKGIMKFFWGGKSAMMGEMPPLEPYQFDANIYDYIIFGSPVWAARFAPPIKTFINENINKLKYRKIGAYVCYSGSGADAALDRLEESLGKPLENKLTLIDPMNKPSSSKEQAIEEFISRIN